MPKKKTQQVRITGTQARMKAIQGVHARIEKFQLDLFDLKESTKRTKADYELAMMTLATLIRDKTDLLFDPETGEVVDEAAPAGDAGSA